MQDEVEAHARGFWWRLRSKLLVLRGTMCPCLGKSHNFHELTQRKDRVRGQAKGQRGVEFNMPFKWS